MDTYARDLERWLPRLVAIWRRSRGVAERRTGRLTPNEIREVAAGVRRLSLGLTRDRSLAGTRYMDDPKLLGAYLLFFWPVSYAQARQVLGELPVRPRRVLDLGSGPAPLAFAALDAGAVAATAVDRSSGALALARELAMEADEALSVRQSDVAKKLDAQIQAEPYDLIVAGHLLNELFMRGDDVTERRADWVEEVLGLVKVGGSLVLLEPALRETSRDLLRVRDLLVQRGFAVRAPCLFRGNCPALVRESDWCHAERDWQMPREVEELARAAGLRKESLKMSYLVLAPRGEAWPTPPPGRVFRIVSEPLQGKGRRRYIGCGPEGRLGLALQEKHRAKQNEVFFELNRGDLVEITGPEARGDGLALTERSQAKRISRAGQPTPPLPLGEGRGEGN